MTGYGIYDLRKNKHTKNWGGEEWVVDGERGFATYPGDLDADTVCTYYRYGIDYAKEDGHKMTRRECEAQILDLLGQIENVCDQYKPGMSVNLSVCKGHWNVFSLNEENEDEYNLDAVRFEDGEIWYEFEKGR